MKKDVKNMSLKEVGNINKKDFETLDSKTQKEIKNKLIINEINEGIKEDNLNNGKNTPTLDVKKEFDGKEKIVKVDSEGNYRGTIDPQIADNDIYYSMLYTRIVNQKVQEIMEGGAQLLGNSFNEEEWQNGVKELIFNALPELNDYKTSVSIDEWNPAQSNSYTQVFNIDFRKVSREKFDQLGIISVFTNPAKLGEFVNDRIANLSKAHSLFIQNEQAKILLNDPNAVLKIEYDKTISTAGKSTIEVMRQVNEIGASFQTASNQHIAFGTKDKDIVYSGSIDDLVMIITPSFLGAIQTDVELNQYNPNALVHKVDKFVLDFEKIEGIDQTLAGEILFVLMDKKALMRGYQLKGTNWDYKAPNGQLVREIHNWFGFGRNPIKPIYLFTSKAETPPSEQKIKKTTKKGKK